MQHQTKPFCRRVSLNDLWMFKHVVEHEANIEWDWDEQDQHETPDIVTHVDPGNGRRSSPASQDVRLATVAERLQFAQLAQEDGPCDALDHADRHLRDNMPPLSLTRLRLSFIARVARSWRVASFFSGSTPG